VFDSVGGDARLPQEDIARRIYDSLAGFRGAIRVSEERVAWAKSKIRINEYDYYLRGQSLYLRSTLDDVLNARAIYQEGLEQHPVSVLLRINLSWTYLWTATNQVKSGPGPDIEQAWRLAKEALSAQPHSRLEAWLAHWLMAFLHQWHDEDFPRSLVEAWAAVELAPYDGLSRNGLSRVLANAGYGNEAIAWARSGLDHDPNAPSWYRANLAWASHIAGRDQEAIEVLREKSTEYPVLYAALHARLGRIDEARALVADYVKSGGGDVIEWEDMFPILEPIETEYLEALRKAGLPER
jgi:adenylate cyclase